MDSKSTEQQIQQHLDAIRRLQASAESEAPKASWPPEGYYLLWHVLVGMMMGSIGAGVSLLANVIGAPLFGKPPLQLIRVYLTFPMGEQALAAEAGLVLTVGCGLYLVTGAIYGIAFHLLMSTVSRFRDAPAHKRFLIATGLGLALWVVNFYLILSWLQPLLLGGNWIVKEVPFWVAALTHLAFAWTMYLIEGWGRFEAYRVRRAAAVAMMVLAAGVAAPAAAQPAGGARKASAGPASPADPKPADYPYWQTVRPGEYRGFNQRASLRQRGKAVYEKYCSGCHGVDGDGDGPAARRLITKPRDFTSGTYKFRSTDSTSLPLESDLHRTLTHGLSRVSMPAFPLMPEHDKLAVIEYIKGFYPDWDDEAGDRTVVPVPRRPADLDTTDRVRRGRFVYVAMQCGTCHGPDGSGAGAEKTVFEDAWGNEQRPFDFTRGRLKAGDDPEDIYRTFHAGLISVMPAYGPELLASANVAVMKSQTKLMLPDDMPTLTPHFAQFPADTAAFVALEANERARLGERNSWDLVAYIRSLTKSTSTAAAVLGDGASE